MLFAETTIDARFAGEPFGFQAFAVLVEGLLRSLMIPHGLLGIGPAFSVARFPLFRGEDSGRALCKLIVHVPG